jgi:hypothetical protein
MPLSEIQREEVGDVAELEVRRYFDHYLGNVFPGQVQQMVKAHDLDEASHGGVAKKVSRCLWLLLGAGVAGGFGAGFGLKNLLILLGTF